MMKKFISPTRKKMTILALVLFATFGAYTYTTTRLSASQSDGEPHFLASSLSNDAYILRVITLKKSKIGCAAITRKLKYPLSMSLFLEGEGTLSVARQIFGLSGTEDIISVPVNIGGHNSKVDGLVDGSFVTLTLSSDQIRESKNGKLNINGHDIDYGQYISLLSKTAECLNNI